MMRLKNCLGLLLGLLGQQDCLNVRQDSSLSDGHSGQELVELLVVPDGELKVSGDDPGLLVVSGSIACQLEYFSSQVLKDGSQVDWSSCSNSFGEVAFSEQPVDSTHRELKSGSRRPRLGLRFHFSSFSSSRHDR